MVFPSPNVTPVIFQVKILQFSINISIQQGSQVSKVPWSFPGSGEGAEDLPTNYFTAGVVTASIKRESVDPNNLKCQGCEENEATDYCKDCDLHFCSTCKKTHLRPKVSAHHQFITIDEALKGGSASSTPRILHCQKHPHLEVNSYCKTDQTAICSECVVDAHIGHDVSRLVDISKGFKDTISTLVTKVRFDLFMFSGIKIKVRF